MVSIDDLKKIGRMMDEADVPPENRMIRMTPEFYRRVKISVLPWWRRWFFRLFPGAMKDA